MTIGVDLSQWNSKSNIAQAKKAGLGFVIARAGSGVTTLDNKFNDVYGQCKAAGMPIGVYWYLYALNVQQAKNEANIFVSRLKGKTFEYPVWLDFEDPSQNKLSKTLKTQMAIAFMNILEKNGFYTGLYTMGSWFARDFDYNYKYEGKTLKDFDKWVAHWTYSTSKKSNYVDGNTGIWQYSDRGSFSGIGTASGGLDMNLSYKDYPSIMKAAGLNGFKKQVVTPEVKPLSPVPKALISYVNPVDINAILPLIKFLTPNYTVEVKQSGTKRENFSEYGNSKWAIGVGGRKEQHTSYINYLISGKDRYETEEKVLEFVNYSNRREKYKVK